MDMSYQLLLVLALLSKLVKILFLHFIKGFKDQNNLFVQVSLIINQ